jgi:hypothetical protein
MQAAGPYPWPGSNGRRDPVSGLTASDLEAADLLALARLDDDGAPCPSGLPWSQPGRPGPDNDRGRPAVADDDAAPKPHSR